MRFAMAAMIAAATTGCQGSTGVQSPVPQGGDPTIEVVVANQQAASASLLGANGTSMKHVQVGTGPHEAQVSPDGRVGVVTVYGTQVAGNRLAVIDLVRDSVVRTIDLGQYTRPHGVIFLGNSSDRVVVTSEATSNVVLVNLATGTVEAIPTNARGSHMIAVTADGTRGWTANIADNSVSEIDLAGKRFVRAILVPTRPEGIGITPDGAQVWVGSNDTGEVTVLSGSTGQKIATVTGATFPYRLTGSRDGKLMTVVDGQGNRLMIADVATQKYIGSISLTNPRGVAIGSDSRTAYVTLAEGALAVVDLVSRTVLRTIPVQASPDGVGVGVRR